MTTHTHKYTSPSHTTWTRVHSCFQAAASHPVGRHILYECGVSASLSVSNCLHVNSSIQLILLYRANFESGRCSCEVWECKLVRLVRVSAHACTVSCTGWVVCAATHTILMPKGRAIREQRGAKLREELGTDGAEWRQRTRKRQGAVTYP